MSGPSSLSAILAVIVALLASPAAAQGEIVITQAKALAGNVTPGDTAGFPVSLSLSGSYVLAGNLNVPAGQNGISVNAHNVDLDMNGFTITGGGVANYGVVSGFGESRIHDGVINRFRFSGLYIRNNSWTVENMQLVRNSGLGVDATNTRFLTVTASLIASNGSGGIVTGDDGRFSNLTVSSNSGRGITCAADCMLHDSKISGNRGDGVFFGSGFVDGNYFFRNESYAVSDQSDPDTGMSNNLLLKNNDPGADQFQRRGTVDVLGNKCIGKPC